MIMQITGRHRLRLITSIHLSYVFDKGFLVYQTSVQTVLKDAHVAQAELDEALIDQIHRRMDI